MVISRDHHDVSGTDSPFRETANVYDGSAFCAGVSPAGLFLPSMPFSAKTALWFLLLADMAVHNFVGDAFRGATWVALHNGGGVGW